MSTIEQRIRDLRQRIAALDAQDGDYSFLLFELAALLATPYGQYLREQQPQPQPQ